MSGDNMTLIGIIVMVFIVAMLGAILLAGMLYSSGFEAGLKYQIRPALEERG